MTKRIFSLLLCFALVLSLILPVWAQENGGEKTLVIRTREEFLKFAENCRLDSYSTGLAVSLEADIDLTGVEFSGIPIFSGTLDGGGHTVSGLNITSAGSDVGLFRYLTEEALVKNLTLRGDVHPGGSRSTVGAFAGRNAGRINNCQAFVNVSGSEFVGGFVGRNAVTGMLEECLFAGELYGDHFVGGMAGENNGVIRNCENRGKINTTPQQNTVDLSDITMETLTGSESGGTVTDIGGIAGLSGGVIRDCVNRGAVGYRHMGYNIGGIAGTQSGTLLRCENYGSIQGRKEVGGIVGQMEPVSLIEYTEDTLQILQDQLDVMSGMVNRASGNAGSNASRITGQIGLLQDQAQTARDSLETIFSGGSEEGELPDPDAILAAQNSLTGAMNAMPGTINGIAGATRDTVGVLSSDLRAISGQINAMGQTIRSAGENLGGTLTDISDQDTPDLLTGKISACINHGAVLADRNAGGIVGAMAVETDLDVLEDWQQSGEESMNYSSELRAVVLDCENQATVTATKQNIGGIVGWQSMGLVKNCVNSGAVAGAGGDYVGGISGMSAGYIRDCSAKCPISGSSFVGGIAGSASIVTDSRAFVRLAGGMEKLGAILGVAEESRLKLPEPEKEETPEQNGKKTAQTAEPVAEKRPVSGNFYLVEGKDPGAIDGISYAGMAEPLSREDFLALENLADLFRQVRITFRYSDGSRKILTCAPGETLQTGQIPDLPQKEGYTAAWVGLTEETLENLEFDLTFEAAYTPLRSVIACDTLRENRPLALAEGAFTQTAALSLTPGEEGPDLTEGKVLESWTLSLTEQADTIRFLPPAEGNAVCVYLCDGDGNWQAAQYTWDGSYLVIPVTGVPQALAVAEAPAETGMWYLLGGAAVAAVGLFLLLRKKKA